MAKKTLYLTLQPNFITADPNDYYGRVQYQQVLTNDDIAREIAKERTELRVETISYIMDMADTKKAEKVAEGFIINTPFCIAKAGTSGVYNSATEQFSKDKHSLSINFLKGMASREQLANVDVKVQGVAETGPVIGAVTDALTGAKDSSITPNNVIQIIGNKLKIGGDGDDIGLKLRNIDTDDVVRIKQIIVNEPRQIIAMLPDVPVGSYELELTTAYSGTNEPLKTPKTSVFSLILSVE
ncbi:DNA-binding domain-containing protein [Carboxylicivirga sp. RSCT41]|uniref:DNA-binding domain-containing protein n=1 Tax=Carboxylicivirga agarovorans TaxID=3417570 RepID=UPI003D32DB19